MSTVRDVLSSKLDAHSVWCIESTDSVFQAIRVMSERNIGALVVVSGERIVGVVTERDYARKIVLQNRASKATPVAAIMSTPVLYVTPEDSVESCMALMTQERVRHLPVLANGNLVGLISQGDLVRALISDREFLLDELIRYVTGSATIDAQAVYKESIGDPPVRTL